MSYYNTTVLIQDITPKEGLSINQLINYLKKRKLTVRIHRNRTLSCEGEFGEGGLGKNGDLDDWKGISEKKISRLISKPVITITQCRNHDWTQSIYVTRYDLDGTSKTKFVSLHEYYKDDWFNRFQVETRN